VVFLFHPSGMDVQEQPGHTKGHADAPPDTPEDMRRVRTRTSGQHRAGPGGMRRVSQQCERLYTPDTIGVVVTPVLCPAGAAGVYSTSTGAPGCVRVMGVPGWVAVDFWSWTTGGGSCLRVPALHGTRVAPRETRYAHAGGGKVFSFLFRKEKLRPSNERIGKRTHATSQGACIRHRDKRADTQRQSVNSDAR
jgi:hypothetical protein